MLIRYIIFLALFATQRPAHGEWINAVRPAQNQSPEAVITAITTPAVLKDPASMRDTFQAVQLRDVIGQQTQQMEQLNRQYAQIKDQMAKLQPSPWDKWLPAIFGLLGTISASLVAFALQNQRLRFDRAASRQAAGIKEVSEIKQFRSQQLNEFYAPLEALLGQGLVVRNEFYRRMRAKAVPSVTFTEMPDKKAAMGWSLGIQHSDHDTVPFRLIDEMPFVQHAYPELMGNVGEIVRINRLIVTLIHEKVGLVLHNSTELSQQLGIFLAHQSVLEDLYKSVKSQGKTNAYKLGYTTTFPRDLPLLVRKDCEKLREELKKWEEDVSQWMGEMALGKDTTT